MPIDTDATNALVSDLGAILGAAHVRVGDAIEPEYLHDESLTVAPVQPRALVLPGTSDEVARVLAYCNTHGIPVAVRAGGTGLSGGCTPIAQGILLALDRMRRIVEIDTDNQVAVCEPFVRLSELYEAVAAKGLMYAIFPGESSATIGGNVGTNAGGMQAIKYGVTRHHVLGLTAVLADGSLMRTGGKVAKISSGYDLTQLIIGSEGTLAVVTEVILKLVPRLAARSAVLAPFRTLEEVTRAIPKLVATGRNPLMLEYIDMLTMAVILERSKMDLGIDPKIRETALAYLLVVTEGRDDEVAAADAQHLAELCAELGAIDVFMLPSNASRQLIEAREQSFWAGKAAGAGDIIDVVVPRASLSAFIDSAARLGKEHGALVAGCGHAGDGNVHLAVFHPEPETQRLVTKALLKQGIALGGAVSGEHGIGLAKKSYFMEFEDPIKLALQKRIKLAFDPKGILNPGKLFD
jgi:glycolate oxidase